MIAAWLAGYAAFAGPEPEPEPEPGPAAAADADDADDAVLAQIDWQGHPGMQLTWRFFAPGLSDAEPILSHHHRFSQVATRPYLERSGVRLFLMAAMAAERARNPHHARALVTRTFDYVEAFVARHPDGWAIAHSPAEARALLRDTDKRVIVQSVEGGHELLRGPDDARYLRDHGVALVTLIHLRDDELGGAAILPMWPGKLINPVGARRNRDGERRGLTARGAQAIVELDQAGILVDFSHMSPDTVDDALAVTKAHGIAPVVTHGKLQRLHHSEFGWRDDQVLEVYRQGGVFSLGLSPQMLDPVSPLDEVPADVCRGSVEMWRFHYDAVRSLVLDHAEELVGAPADALGPAARTRLAVGWSSDWNGWVSHAAPVYGRCRPRSELPADRTPFDVRGLADPSLLPGQWTAVERLGTDLDPMLRSAERFLELWAEARGEAP